MKPKLETWTIVAAGAWNTRLFTPEWVGTHLFDKRQISVEVPLAAGVAGLKFIGDDLLVIPSDDRLMVAVSRVDDKTLANAERLMCKALELLRHTPVQAVGINFGFEISDPNERVTSLFRFGDVGEISDIGGDIKSSAVSRRIDVSGGVVVLTHSWANDKFGVHMNYHSDVGTADAAVAQIRNRVITCKESAYNFLKTVYGLQQDEEIDG